MSKALTSTQKSELLAHEKTIEDNIGGVFAVGLALQQIRDEGLYLDPDKPVTFVQYLRVRWDLSKSRGYQMIDAIGVMNNIRPVIVAASGQEIIPAHEAQIRPLNRLTPDDQRTTWRRVVSVVDETGGQLTASMVKMIANKVAPPPEKKKRKVMLSDPLDAGDIDHPSDDGQTTVTTTVEPTAVGFTGSGSSNMSYEDRANLFLSDTTRLLKSSGNLGLFDSMGLNHEAGTQLSAYIKEHYPNEADLIRADIQTLLERLIVLEPLVTKELSG